MNKIIQFIHHNQRFFIALSIGIILRLFFMSFPAFKIDMDAWIAWGARMLSVGPNEFYNTTDWTAYFPGYLYFLWLIAALESVFFAPARREMLEFLYKVVPVLFDVGCGAMVYVMVEYLRKTYTDIKSKSISVFTSILYFISPFAVFNGAIWGQADSVHSFFMLISLYSLFKGNHYRAAIFMALAVSVKPQALFMAPAYAMYYLKNFDIKKIINSAVAFAITFVVIVLPFYGLNLFDGISKVMQANNEAYGYNSLNTFNFWGTYGFWIADSTIHWFGLPMKTVGLLLFTIFQLIGLGIFYYFFILKKHAYTLPFAALFSVYSIFTTIMFVTQMHERYMYPLFGFLLVFVGYYTLKIYGHLDLARFVNPLSIYFVILAVLHGINHYYVYIYYAYFGVSVPLENTFYYFVSNNILLWSYIITAMYFIFVLALPYYLKEEKLYDKGK